MPAPNSRTAHNRFKPETAAETEATELERLKAEIAELESKVAELEGQEDEPEQPAGNTRGQHRDFVEEGTFEKSMEIPGTTLAFAFGGYAKLDYLQDLRHRRPIGVPGGNAGSGDEPCVDAELVITASGFDLPMDRLDVIDEVEGGPEGRSVRVRERGACERMRMGFEGRTPGERLLVVGRRRI